MDWKNSKDLAIIEGLVGKKKQRVIKKLARLFLTSTDWYIIRSLETGIEIPQEILDKRAQARIDAGEI